MRPAAIGQMFGVEIFADSRLLRVVLCQLHYDAVDPPCEDRPPFPLADAADRSETNANLVVYLLRQHQADERILLVDHHRYFHRDSRDPSDGLDLKRTHVHTASVVDEHGIDTLVFDFCRFIATNDAFALTAPPEVYDFSTAPIEAAIDAFTQLPFVHTTVCADGGVRNDH